MSYRSVKNGNLSVIARRIKQLRENANETQEVLARKINMSTTTLSKIEQDIINLTLENARRIADHYNVSIDWICGRVDDMSVSENVLNTLCRYIKISTHVMSIRQTHKIPFISINQYLFDFLNVLNDAYNYKKNDVPDEVIGAWLEKEKEKTLNFFQSESKEPFVKYALLSQRDIASDETMELIENTYQESIE